MVFGFRWLRLQYTDFTVQQTGMETCEFDASIVIVSFNTREMLRECIESVRREAGGLRVEILVVDNASRDGSPEMLEKDFPEVRLFRSGTNLGFGAANNVALKEARGEYFVLLNSDAFLQPGSLQLAKKHMDETPACGLGGGLLVGRDGAWQPSARSFHSVPGDMIVMTGLAGRYPKSKFFGSFDRTWADVNEAASVDWVPGAFCIIRPAALDKVGLFDPAFFLYYEEVDLCLRIKQAGYSVWYWPDVKIVHIGGESSRQLKSLEFSKSSAQVVLWRMRSTFLYYRKHLGWQVNLARWAETGLYEVTILRNRWSRSAARQERAKRYRTLVRLMNEAWKDTRGGRVSPPTPW
jgi:GT2 family glycosyltransferase